MPDIQPTTINCPACGAPLDIDGKSSIVRCKFCRNVSLVPGILPNDITASNLALDEVRRLISGGNLAEAVKQYRQLFNASLKEASDAVEALQAGRLVDLTEIKINAQNQEDLTEALKEIQKLLADGKKIEAIKVYRENYEVSLERAKYAVDQIEAGQAQQPEGGVQIPKSAELAGQETKKGTRLGVVITFLVVLFVGGIIAFVLFLPGGPFVPRLIAQKAVLVPGTAGASPQVAALLYNPDADKRMIGLLDGETGKMRWKADPLAGDGFAQSIQPGGDLIYVANETDLLAYRVGDGSLVWQAQLPDRLNYGDHSLLVADGRVIVNTVDQSVQAYDAATGNKVWSYRLAGYDRDLRLMGGALVLIDYTGDNHTYSLIFLDPAVGRQRQAVTPNCKYDEYSSVNLDLDSGMVYDAANNALYLVYASPNGCIQRLDLASGAITWQSTDQESFTFSPDSFLYMMTADSLIFNSNSRLLAVAKATGKLQVLVNDQDYEFVPLAETGNRIIVRAKRTRGTERFELWGLDASSGERMWQVDLGTAEPIDPPDVMAGLVDKEDLGWTWQLVPAGLAVLKFKGEPNQLVLDTVKLEDGSLLSEQTLAMKFISGDFYSVPDVISRQGNLIYLNIDANLCALDLSAGKFKFIH